MLEPKIHGLKYDISGTKNKIHGLKYDISGVLQHILFKKTIYWRKTK